MSSANRTDRKNSEQLEMSFIEIKGSVREKWKGDRLNAIKKRFWSLLILLLSVTSIRRKLLKTTYTEERSIYTNSERCNIRLRP